jgi:Xaa-Pro dipeptidase
MDVWCGAQMSRDDLRKARGADVVYYDDEWDQALRAVDARGAQTVFVPSHQKEGEAARPAPLPAAADGLFSGVRVDSTALTLTLANRRAFKSDEEIACLRLANDVSGEAHVATWRHCSRNRGDIFEYEVEGVFASETTRGGLRHLGYPTIAGAGRNAATLHYERNDSRTRAEDLVLVDAGAEYRGYTADITRTFPAGGVFESRRRAVYEAVLDIQNASIREMLPNTDYALVQSLARVGLASRLKDLGVLRGNPEDAARMGVASLFMPHALGHFLGLQVHDVGPEGPVPEILMPGHVVTCEPGIYFVDRLLGPAFEDARMRDFLVRDEIEKFMDVGGVRIEDDVAVTKTGYENLTACPKTVQEIEEIMKAARER